MKPMAKKDIFTKIEIGVTVIITQRRANQPSVIAVRVGFRHS